MAREKDRKKFVELAEKRVRRALNDIRLIGNLSNRSNYTYTDDDAKKIYKALHNANKEKILMTDEELKSLCMSLIKADTEAEVVSFLQRAGLWDRNEFWRFY